MGMTLVVGIVCSILGPLLVGMAAPDMHRKILGVLFFLCNGWIWAGPSFLKAAQGLLTTWSQR